MGTCETCKFWTGEERKNPTRRKCERIDLDGCSYRDPGEYGDLPALTEGSEHGHADLLTMPTFGCTEWRAKT